MAGKANNVTSKVSAVEHSIFAEYKTKTPQSSELYERARKSLAGGVTGNLRYFEPYPLYESGGQGSKVYDADGNQYIDCFLCNGPLLLGHNHPAVLSAIEEYKSIGSLVVNPSIMIEAAELLQKTVPCAERIRFLNSGTEAVIMAVRYARAYSGKTKIIKFHGHYHGQQDQLLTGLTDSKAAFGDGVPTSITDNTVLAKYDDIEALEKTITENTDIAAIILDPAMHAGGLWGSSKDYLIAVRDLNANGNI